MRPEPDRACAFLKVNEPQPKPRTRGLTEIRGPYYAPVGPHYLEDLLAAWGGWVDSFKFGGGSFALLPRQAVRELIDLCHRHGVSVSTGGFLEYVLTQGRSAVAAYLAECKDLGFDTVEISAGFITLATDDWLRLVEAVRTAGLRPKPELGIQFGAGGASAPEALESAGTSDVEGLIRRARRFLDAGVELLMIESEGITESVHAWRTDVAARVAGELGLEHVMFEAADPAVFAWYVRSYGPDVNLFVDHSQIVQLACLRAGIWGTNESWGRIQSFRDG